MINPQWLETFVTLVKTGNFTRTAEQLFMTQPGVSQHLKKLEEACACQLIIRLGKGIELTEQGNRVYEHAIQLNKHEQALLESLSFDKPFEGKCLLACSGALAQRIYPLLTDYQVKHPKLSIHLEVSPNRGILSSIQNATCDLGMVTQAPDAELFSSQSIGAEELSIILPKNSAVNESNIADKLVQLGLINHPDAMHYLKLYFSHSKIPSLEKLDPNRIYRKGYINQLSQILLPVSKGLGFTVLPTKVVESFSQASTLHIFPTKIRVAEPIYFVKTTHRTLPARYENIQALIKKELTAH